MSFAIKRKVISLHFLPYLLCIYRRKNRKSLITSFQWKWKISQKPCPRMLDENIFEKMTLLAYQETDCVPQLPGHYRQPDWNRQICDAVTVNHHKTTIMACAESGNIFYLSPFQRYSCICILKWKWLYSTQHDLFLFGKVCSMSRMFYVLTIFKGMSRNYIMYIILPYDINPVVSLE